MDERVVKALQKWPNVPHVFGWLRLSPQGGWLITHPDGQASKISNARVINFISRHYGQDQSGQFYFQNGPQRVYVSLALTPWVYFIYPCELKGLVLVSHTGTISVPQRVLEDEQGRLFFVTELGVGLLNRADVSQLLNWMGESSGEFGPIQVPWVVPIDPELELGPLQIACRLAPGQAVGIFTPSLPIEQVNSADLPTLYSYVVEPK